MNIRMANIKDLDKITDVEAKCFPKAEAASKESFEKRLTVYSNHFWLLEDGEKLVGFVNGMVTDEDILRDEMYDNGKLHNEQGQWQMIFGVGIIPEYRRQGFAEKILNRVIDEAREEGRKGLVLTCKDKLVHYYAKFGFKDQGISESTHGNAVWHDMRLVF